MNLLQNLLITDKARVFWKVFLAFSYSIRMGLSLAKLLMSPQKKVVSSAKFTILISWSPVSVPLFPCHFHWNGWRPWLENRETWRVGSLQNYLHDESYGLREETIYFYFLIKYCSTRFISGSWNCNGTRGMETKQCNFCVIFDCYYQNFFF